MSIENINPPPKAEWSTDRPEEGKERKWVYLAHPEYGWVVLSETDRIYEGEIKDPEGNVVKAQILERISRVSRPL